MDEDPFSALHLTRMRVADRTVLDPFFHLLERPLSDYTFANTVIWAGPINVHWAILHGCLCVFANGAGDLILLMPPLGDGDTFAAIDKALARCRIYNGAAGIPNATRIEYVSQAWLDSHPILAGWRVAPMGGDYIYPTGRMIDLAGPDLASKRQSRNRFARRHQARVEDYSARHLPACLELLARWDNQVRQFANQTGDNSHVKRSKETDAVEVALRNHRELGLTGMVLWADDKLAGFTFGEPLGEDCFSVIIEKTDRQFVGAAQYIFSEFCRRYWADRPWCNVGDDWGIENLARVKESYRPLRRDNKFTLFPPPLPDPIEPSSAERMSRPVASAPLVVDSAVRPI